MTLLDERPAAAEVPPPPAPIRATPTTWRFALRLARRETRRRPGRTVLAALLIAVPVMAMTVGSVLAHTDHADWSAQFERRYGNADIAVDPSFFAATYTEDAGSMLPAGTTVVEYLWTFTPVTPERLSRTDGSLFGAVTDVRLDEAGAPPAIEIRDGRAPVRGEILLSAEMADLLGVSVGDEVTLLRPSGTWTVSGIGRHRDQYGTGLFVIPDLDVDRIVAEQRQTITLYDLPDGTPAAEIERAASALGGVTATHDPFGGIDEGFGRGLAWGWVAGALTLIGVGIIVAAAFATSARRQLVTIGQLSANGATPSIVQRTLALQGTWTGVIGAGAGIGAGFAALPFARPLIERIVHHDVGAYRYSLVDLVVIAATAVVAGTLAAVVPARTAARIPVMAALAGRRPQGRPPRWLVPVGLALLAGGLGLIAVAALGINDAHHSGNQDVWLLLVVLGVVGVVFGMCSSTPLVVDRLGRLGRRASLSWRLALRSLARSRTRSSAVVAAIAVAVGGAVAAATIVEAVVRTDQSAMLATLPADTVVLELWRDPGIGEARIDLGPLADAAVPDDLHDRVVAIVPDATITPLWVTTVDPPAFDPTAGGDPWPILQGPRVATPALLDILGLSADDVALLERAGALQPLAPGSVLGGDIVAQYPSEGGTVEVAAPMATDPYRFDFAGWNLLVTERNARELGFDVVQGGVIVRADEPLTGGQRDRLRALTVEINGGWYDAFVEPGDPPRVTPTPETGPVEQWAVHYDEPEWRDATRDDIWIARGVIAGVAVLVSLLVVAVGLSLAAAEGRDERDVLTVVGARPASQRRQAAAKAVVLATTGIALGVPTGFVPAWVLYRIVNSGGGRPVEGLQFPWLVVAGLVVAVPAIVATVAWTGSGIAQRYRPVSPTRRD